MDAEIKYNKLKDILREMGEVTVAYSGGVDSTFLLKVAFEVLRHKAVGVIAVSPSLPGREYEKAVEVAGMIGIRLITVHKIRMVEQAEDYLSDLGFSNIRARHTGSSVRIEVDPAQIGLMMEPELRQDIVKKLREIGYKHISVDLEGYRRGSLNGSALSRPAPTKINEGEIRIIK